MCTIKERLIKIVSILLIIGLVIGGCFIGSNHASADNATVGMMLDQVSIPYGTKIFWENNTSPLMKVIYIDENNNQHVVYQYGNTVNYLMTSKIGQQNFSEFVICDNSCISPTTAIASKNGYTFKGWSTDSNYKTNTPLSTNYSSDMIIGALNMDGTTKNLYSVYTLDQYNIAYNLNSGDAQSELKTVYNVEDNEWTLPIVKRYGYRFLGWTTNYNSNASRSFTIVPGSNSIYGDITAIANFTPSTASPANGNAAGITHTHTAYGNTACYKPVYHTHSAGGGTLISGTNLADNATYSAPGGCYQSGGSRTCGAYAGCLWAGGSWNDGNHQVRTEVYACPECGYIMNTCSPITSFSSANPWAGAVSWTEDAGENPLTGQGYPDAQLKALVFFSGSEASMQAYSAAKNYLNANYGARGSKDLGGFSIAGKTWYILTVNANMAGWNPHVPDIYDTTKHFWYNNAIQGMNGEYSGFNWIPVGTTSPKIVCNNTITAYTRSCGKTTSTIDSYALNCSYSTCGSACVRIEDTNQYIGYTKLSCIQTNNQANWTPLSYNWTTSDGSIISGQNTATCMIAKNGTYTCTVGYRDNKNTSNTGYINILYTVSNLD